MAIVSIDLGLECLRCGEKLKHEEDEVNMIFRIEPCLCYVEEEKKIIRGQLRQIAAEL
jgi:hypothetical protein